MNNLTAPEMAALRRRRMNTPALDATRLSLLGRLKDHADQEGWQRFLDTYGGLIFSLAIKGGLSPVEAEEVLQETLVSVAGEMPDFHYDRKRGSFKGWLFQITRRRIADHCRKRTRQQRLLEPMPEDLPEVADPTADALQQTWDEEWKHHCLHQAVERVKARVSPAQWQMFELAVIQECPTENICALLGVNRARVYMARMRVGRLLKEELQTARET